MLEVQITVSALLKFLIITCLLFQHYSPKSQHYSPKSQHYSPTVIPLNSVRSSIRKIAALVDGEYKMNGLVGTRIHSL